MTSVYDMSKFDLAKKFKCDVSEVLDAKRDDINPESLKHAKVIKGFISMERLGLTDLGNVEVIVGDFLNFFEGQKSNHHALTVGPQAKTLGKLKVVYGNISLGYKCKVDFGNLKDVYGNMYLNHTYIKSMGKIENIYGICSFDHSIIEDLGNNIKHIDNIMVTTDFNLKSFGSLESTNQPIKSPNKKVEDSFEGPTAIRVFEEGEIELSKLISNFIINFTRDENTGKYVRNDIYLASHGV